MRRTKRPGRAADLVGAVLQGVGEGGDLLALDELDAGVAERDAEGSGDGASDDYGLGGEGEKAAATRAMRSCVALRWCGLPMISIVRGCLS